MKTATWIFLAATAALLTGCVLPRTGGKLAAAKKPLDRTAILPLRAEDTYVYSGPTNYLVQVGNAVLTMLASGRNSLLIPPAQMEAIIQSNGISDALFHEIPYADSGGSILTNDPAGLQHLEAFAAETRIKRVVRTQISYWGDKVDPYGLNGLNRGEDLRFLWGLGWGGSVVVRMQLVNLSPARVLAQSYATSNYGQTSGAFMMVIPFYVGTTIGRSVDKAARQAMEELFDHERTGTNTGQKFNFDAESEWRAAMIKHQKSRDLPVSPSSAEWNLHLNLKSRGDVVTATEPRRDAPPVRLMEVRDRRPETGRIGERHAAFGVKMGDVYSSRDVAEYVRENLELELAAAGYRRTSTNADVNLTCELNKFWLHTRATAFYWDVIADIREALIKADFSIFIFSG